MVGQASSLVHFDDKNMPKTPGVSSPRPCLRISFFFLSCAGVLTETTAELAAALTLSAARRVPEADVFMRAGKYKGWLPTLFVGQLLQVCAAGLR